MAEKKAKEIRQEEILRAASACFSRKGYKGSSISDICKAAGIAKGGLYWHFSSKREILLALLDNLCSSRQDQWSMLSRVDISEEGLIGAGWAFIETNLANPEKIHLFSMLEEEARGDEELMTIYRQTQDLAMERLTAFARRVLEKYADMPLGAEDLASLLNLLVVSLSRQLLLNPDLTGGKALWEGTVRSLLR